MIEDFSMLGPADVLALDQYQEQPAPAQLQPSETVATPSGKRGRKRKNQLPEPVVEESVVREASAARASLDVAPPPTADSSTTMPPPALQQHPGLGVEITPTIPSLETDLAIDQIEPSMNLSGMTPVGLHGDYGGMMTPHHHGIDQLESIPNLPVDQVSSILNGASMDGYSNMGFDDGHHADSGGMSERIGNDWNDDYDFPPSVGAHVSFLMLILYFKHHSID